MNDNKKMKQREPDSVSISVDPEDKKPTKEDAQKKWERLPEEMKAKYKREFGLLAQPLWIYFATQCGFTEDGKKL